MSEAANIEVVRRYLTGVERFDVEVVADCLDTGAEQIEQPNRLYAKGQVRGREVMLRDLPRGAKILRRQSYQIETIFGAGEMVTAETRWEGIVDVPVGALKPGDAMVAHSCMVFTLADGKIVRQVNYDCYEPF